MLFEWLSTQYRDKKLKEAAELIENSLRETVKAGIKMGILAVNHQRPTLQKQLQKGSDVKAENKR